MFHLTYVSSATQDFSKADLNELLAQCRENNTKLDLTGMLLFKDGNFMQVLEGDEGVVRELYTKISTDPRHTGEIILLQGPLEDRQFSDWSMGFRDLNSPQARTTAGYNEFLNTPLTGQEFSKDPTRSQKLLLTFKESM